MTKKTRLPLNSSSVKHRLLFRIKKTIKSISPKCLIEIYRFFCDSKSRVALLHFLSKSYPCNSENKRMSFFKKVCLAKKFFVISSKIDCGHTPYEIFSAIDFVVSLFSSRKRHYSGEQ